MSIQYEQFFKRNGIRSPQFMVQPLTPSIEKFTFPMGSLHHFIINDGVTNGPASDEFLYRDIQKKIMVEHLLDLRSFEGSPKKVGVSLLAYVRQYHNTHKRFRQVQHFQDIGDANTLCVLNYALITRSYRYTRSMYSEYYKWRNLQSTLWQRAAQAATESKRNQFIFVGVPQVVSSKPRLDTYSKMFNQNVLKYFNTPESFFLLEMWKWLNPQTRSESVMGELTEEQLDYINLVYEESGHFALLNLGLLNRWIDTSKFSGDEEEVPATESFSEWDLKLGAEGLEFISNNKTKLAWDMIQKRFLRFMMSMTELRVQAQVHADADADPENAEAVDGDRKTTVATIDPNIIQENGNTTQRTVLGEVNVSEVLDGPAGVDEGSRHARNQKLLETLDDDLKQLELIENHNEQEIKSDVDEAPISVADARGQDAIKITDFAKEHTPLSAVDKRVEELADDGILTASSYKRFKRMIEDNANVKSPFGEEPLHQFAEVPTELVKIKEPHSIPDSNIIRDKSMLKSSLHDFDSHYIEHVMPRNTVSMVTNAQKAGFLVSRYEVEVQEDALGAYETHTVRLNPVEGVPSTIRFKMPKLSENGEYVANGVKYRMRKQRVDMPIRKIAPDRVALTSYYGKTFVARNAKKVNSYGSWLNEQIMAKGLDESNSDISNISPGDSYDNTFKCPRLYSSIAMSFRAFSSHGYEFMFQRRDVLKALDEEVLNRLEAGGQVVCAIAPSGSTITMDEHGTLYEHSLEGEKILGRLETFLNIMTEDAPVEYAEVKVYGKEVPVGVVISYLLGFSKMIELLKVTPRRVGPGQRLNLQDNEYAIVFSDETLIFDREDRLATLILAGFRALDKVTRNFSVHTFDKRGVYLNVLNALGASASYLREIELMDALFIDPITKSLLEMMGEPVTFRGLLVRSSQMLLTDEHPDSLDMNYMRIRGYERMSGAVYTEMVQAIRAHRAKGGRATQPIEMHPYAVWKRIAQDPSISLVKDINPIENLKQAEAVTFAGTGGRGKRSMVKSTRTYHKNDMGVISESTVDSSDVAVNTYLSANPKFNSVYGTTERFDMNRDGPTSLISTSALLSVGSDRDD